MIGLKMDKSRVFYDWELDLIGNEKRTQLFGIRLNSSKRRASLSTVLWSVVLGLSYGPLYTIISSVL
jgi:hypothetical protein